MVLFNVIPTKFYALGPTCLLVFTSSLELSSSHQPFKSKCWPHSLFSTREMKSHMEQGFGCIEDAVHVQCVVRLKIGRLQSKREAVHFCGVGANQMDAAQLIVFSSDVMVRVYKTVVQYSPVTVVR